MNLKLYAFWGSLFICISLSVADIQPIDVEPVIRKEQPDFEDDTGLAADGSHSNEGKESKENGSSSEKKKDFWSWMTSGKNMDFTHAFVASLAIIVVSELGDKTFFIAAIMAMTNPRITVFVGAMTALGFMHVLASLFGYVITYIPRVYTFYASAVLFLFFGLKMIREGWKMKPSEVQEELEEVQMEVRRREGSESRDREESMLPSPSGAVEEGRAPRVVRSRFVLLRRFIPRIFLEAFTLTFLAEWGDRSQIATIVLAANNDIYGIIAGGLLGHFLCTALAVVGGKLIASKISVRTVTMIGGIVFLLFAAIALITGP